jgi:uncharacterized Zn-binding protein involved in type VI secretion
MAYLPTEPTVPLVARRGDLCTGHGCFLSRPALEGSPNVFVNSRPIHRVGDEWESHCCLEECHTSELESGSINVFANNIPVGRVGDPVRCGSWVYTGSPNVFAGHNGHGSHSNPIPDPE